MRADTMTIVGVFDHYGTAEQAARKLEETRIPREAIQINPEMEAAGGGITGFFRRLFGADTPEESLNQLTRQYADVIDHGGALVCVTAAEPDVDRAVDVLNQFGPIDMEARAEGQRITRTEEAPSQTEGRPSQEEQAIPIIEEELQVGKRVIRRGGVRIYEQTVEQPVEEEVTLREEHVEVERRPVDRPVTPEDERNLREQSFEVTETAEEPVVSKKRRVKEEVVVSKETTERKEKIRDTVKRSEVGVESIGQPGQAANYSDDFRRDFDANYAASGMGYERIRPAYEYGYSMARDPRYQGKSWQEVESELKTDYLRRSPDSTWDRVKGAVRYGWEKVTGQR